MMRYMLFAATVLTTSQAVAQAIVVPPAADPGAIQQRQIEEERRRREEERERQKIIEPVKRDTLGKPATQPSVEAVRFLVREIEFTPSEILTLAELEEAAKEFRGRQVSFAELQQLVERINALYRAKNVVTAQAVIPPQDISQGIVRVRLVEGRVGRINIQGNTSTRTGFIADRLRVKPAELVELSRLERAMVRFNRTNDVQLRAELKPGQEFATTDIEVKVTEPLRHDLRLMLDDFGSPATGEWRTSVMYLNHSLFGFRDDLFVSHSEAGGQSSQACSYGFPVNTWGGRLNFAYNKDKSAIKHGSLASLNITGESQGQVLSMRQPAYVGERVQLDVLAGAQKRYSSNWIDSVFLQRTDTRDRNLGLELQAFDAKNYWLASYSLHSVQATVLNTVTVSIDRGTLRYNRDLGEGLSFRGNVTWQSTPQQSLPPSEQFFIGGEGSVRGYAVGVFSGDTGRTLNLELHHPLGTLPAGNHDLATTGFVFLDYGDVIPFRPPHSSLPASEHLTGIGWGLNATLDKRVYTRLTFGYGLTNVPLAPRHYEVHFQLIASIF